MRLSGRHPFSLNDLGSALNLLGRRAEAEALHRELVARSGREYVSSVLLSSHPWLSGRRDEALRWLDRAIEERAAALLFVRRWPVLLEMVEDPEVQERLQKVGL